MDKHELHPSQQALNLRLLEVILGFEIFELKPSGILMVQVYCQALAYYGTIAPVDAEPIEAVELVENIFKEANLGVDYESEIGLFVLIDKSIEAEKGFDDDDEAIQQGMEAMMNGLPYQANPYNYQSHPLAHRGWLQGYADGLNTYINEEVWKG